MLSEAAGRYLIKIYETGSAITPKTLAEQMGVSRPTAFETIKKLEKYGFLEKAGKEYKLTDEGEHVAKRIIRNHRIIETLLYNTGIGLSEACACATKIQGLIDDSIVDKIGDYLGNPKFCPHGKPIPPEESA